MSDIEFIAETLRAQASAIDDLRRRLASVIMVGQVDEISGEKLRLVFEDQDASTGEPFKSPLVRRANSAGKASTGHKERNRPVQGETMALLSPNGEIGRHSRAIPYGPTDESGEPQGDEGYARILAEGNASIAIKDGEIRFKVGAAVWTMTAAQIRKEIGGVSQTMTDAGTTFAGGAIKHDGKSIDASHIHGGILPGPATTDVPAN